MEFICFSDAFYTATAIEEVESCLNLNLQTARVVKCAAANLQRPWSHSKLPAKIISPQPHWQLWRVSVELSSILLKSFLSIVFFSWVYPLLLLVCLWWILRVTWIELGWPTDNNSMWKCQVQMLRKLQTVIVQCPKSMFEFSHFKMKNVVAATWILKRPTCTKKGEHYVGRRNTKCVSIWALSSELRLSIG